MDFRTGSFQGLEGCPCLRPRPRLIEAHCTGKLKQKQHRINRTSYLPFITTATIVICYSFEIEFIKVTMNTLDRARLPEMIMPRHSINKNA